MSSRDIRFRWILLTSVLATVAALVGMTALSLIRLSQATIDANRDAQRTKVLEFTNAVFNRFSPSVRIFWPMNVEGIDQHWQSTGRMPDDFMSALLEVAADSVYSAVYFAPGRFQSCETGSPVYRFDPETVSFTAIASPPPMVCDGIGLLKTRLNLLINDYRWNTKRQFDANRTHNVALINHRAEGVVGYLSYVIDQPYLHGTYLPRELDAYFGDGTHTGAHVWIYDWVRTEVVASNVAGIDYDRRKITVAQRFSDILDTWTVTAAFDDTSALAATRGTLVQNLSLLGAIVLLLLLTFTFLIRIWHKERDLTLRQAGFLANVTHELKTPIAVMQAAGENLADGRVSDPDRLKAYGGHIHTEAVRLRKMVDKLLDVARTESGQLVLKPRPVSINRIVTDYLEESAHLFQDPRIRPELDLAENLPAVMADPDSLDTIIGNLVENALKYGGDTRYLRIATRHSGKTVELDVQDKGTGIPRHAHSLVFDKFYRVEDVLTARTKGHGLGLAIVKTLTEANGGRIELESEPGHGAIFRLVFPALPTPAPDTHPQIHTDHAA